MTPDRARDRGLFPGMVHKRNENEEDPIFIPLNLFLCKFLKSSDCIKLNDDEKIKMDKLLEKYDKVFAASGEPTTYAVHKINTGDHEPIFSPPYCLSFAKTRDLRREIEIMLENDIIEECDSAWASPVVMVPKRNGSVRVCVDYRRLNAVTTPDRYPLPRMDDLLHAAKSTRYMTTLDLQSGY